MQLPWWEQVLDKVIANALWAVLVTAGGLIAAHLRAARSRDQDAIRRRREEALRKWGQ